MLQSIEADLELGSAEIDGQLFQQDDREGEKEEDERVQVEPSDQEVLEQIADIEASGEEGAGRKKPRFPQPKLNETTICGERGIPAIPKLFENFSYDDKKDLYGNLDGVMNKLEHWAHCFFPKLAFDDFIARAEVLGHKRPVQTCLMKIRLGMPLTDEDFAATLAEEETGAGEDQQVQDSLPSSSGMEEEVPFSPPRSPTPVRSPSPLLPSPSPSHPPAPQPLTDEEKARAEANRLRALEIRRKRLEAQRANASAESHPQTIEQRRDPDKKSLNGEDLEGEEGRDKEETDNHPKMMDEEEFLMTLS